MKSLGAQIRIGIVGAGVVGGALRDYLREKSWEPLIYDKYKEIGSLAELNMSAEMIYLCVPTPYIEGVGFDSSAVENAIQAFDRPKVIVIKSTVQPGTSSRLQEQYPQHDILFNPEFLREKTALQDFLHPDRQIVGWTQESQKAIAQSVMDMMPRAPYEVIVPASEAELIKTATNSFLALKLMFANELFDLAAALGIDYELVRAGIAADARIGESHLFVFDDGYRGYGGKCLPKDTMGLIDLAKELGADLTIMEAAHALNQALTSGKPAQEFAA